MNLKIIHKMNLKFIILFLFGFGLIHMLQAQNKTYPPDEQEVIKVIQQLFDGMRQIDSVAIRSTFHPSARLQTTFINKAGNPIIKSESVDEFIKIVGTPHQEMYNERILDYIIQIDANLATAWTPYQFYVSKKFSHCGVNAFQMFKTPDGWRIIQITDTRRKTNCGKINED